MAGHHVADEREPDRLAFNSGRVIERAEVRTAIVEAAVGAAVSLELGAELINASRDVVGAWHERANSGERSLARAIAKLEELVGRP